MDSTEVTSPFQEFDKIIKGLNSYYLNNKNILEDYREGLLIGEPRYYIELDMYITPPLDYVNFKHELLCNTSIKIKESIKNGYLKRLADLKNNSFMDSIKEAYGEQEWMYINDEQYYDFLEFEKKVYSQNEITLRQPEIDLIESKIKGFVFYYFYIVEELENLINEYLFPELSKQPKDIFEEKEIEKLKIFYVKFNNIIWEDISEEKFLQTFRTNTKSELEIKQKAFFNYAISLIEKKRKRYLVKNMQRDWYTPTFEKQTYKTTKTQVPNDNLKREIDRCFK